MKINMLLCNNFIRSVVVKKIKKLLYITDLSDTAFVKWQVYLSSQK